MKVIVNNLVITFFAMILYSCNPNENVLNECIIPVRKNCHLKIFFQDTLKLKTDTLFSDDSGVSNVINKLTTKLDTIGFSIVFNRYGNFKIEYKNLEDLRKQRIEYKLNSYPKIKLLNSKIIQVNEIDYVLNNYSTDDKYGNISEYVTVKNNTVLIITFISHNKNVGLYEQREFIVKHISFDC